MTEVRTKSRTVALVRESFSTRFFYVQVAHARAARHARANKLTEEEREENLASDLHVGAAGDESGGVPLPEGHEVGGQYLSQDVFLHRMGKYIGQESPCAGLRMKIAWRSRPNKSRPLLSPGRWMRNSPRFCCTGLWGGGQWRWASRATLPVGATGPHSDNRRTCRRDSTIRGADIIAGQACFSGARSRALPSRVLLVTI